MRSISSFGFSAIGFSIANDLSLLGKFNIVTERPGKPS